MYPDGVPEIAAATGYPDDDDLAQAIILPRRPSRNRSTRTSWGRRSWAETNGLGMAGLTDHVLELLTGRRPDLERWWAALGSEPATSKRFPAGSRDRLGEIHAGRVSMESFPDPLLLDNEM